MTREDCSTGIEARTSFTPTMRMFVAGDSMKMPTVSSRVASSTIPFASLLRSRGRCPVVPFWPRSYADLIFSGDSSSSKKLVSSVMEHLL